MRIIIAIVWIIFAAGEVGANPNIVVIMTDDQEDTGSIAYMPKTLSLIAKHGVTFKNSFVNLPLCAPSRISFLTGQAAHNHGIRADNPLDAGGWEAFKSKEGNALPVWLQEAGYTTALIGKYINRYGQLRDWVPPGWNLWYAFSGERGPKYYKYSINENGKILHFGGAPADYSTDVLNQRVVRFIRDQSASSDPFFLYVAPKAAHSQGAKPIPSPKYQGLFKELQLPKSPAFNEQDEKTGEQLLATYRSALQSLQSVDDLVAAVIAALKEAGKLDNTAVFYTSDNGFLFGDHGMVGKRVAYEGSIRVPLLMRGPGIPEDQTRDQLVSNLDVVATIVDLAGAKPGVPLDGKSLVPLFANADAPWRSALLIESPVNQFQTSDAQVMAIRTSTHKYIKHESGAEKLFDLRTDPWELTNEASNPTYAIELGDLRRTYDRLRSCSNSNCWYR